MFTLIIIALISLACFVMVVATVSYIRNPLQMQKRNHYYENLAAESKMS